MTFPELDATMAALFDKLSSNFLLDRKVGQRPLGELLEETVRRAACDGTVRFGTPGDENELRRSDDGVMSFLYRPHLFPEMDPALHLGHLVQFALLPRELPAGSPVEVAAMLESYCHLSGDLFGWQPAAGGGLTAWLLDVSGHGVRAGFAAVVFKLLLAQTDPDLPLPALAKDIEERFLELRNPNDPGCLYATGVFVRFGGNTTVEYLSAGHPPILLRRGDASLERIEATTLPLALFPEADAASASFMLDDGDSLLVCTDGLLEMRNVDGQAFGVERLARLFGELAGGPSRVISELRRAMGRFHDLSHLDDDLSVLAIRRAADENEGAEAPSR